MPIKPLPADELFADGPIIPLDWEREEYVLSGHLTPDQIDRILQQENTKRGTLVDPLALIPGAVKRTWTVFADHEPGCETHEFCDCEAAGDDGYLYTQPAAEDMAGALPVTHIICYTPDAEDWGIPNYSRPQAAAKRVRALRRAGWFGPQPETVPQPEPTALFG